MRHSSGPAIAVIVLLVAAMLPALYVLSSGPVLAYHARNPEAATSRICDCNWPLFHTSPSLALRYANWCGASDIEVFFLLQHEQDFYFNLKVIQ